jgi:hypothetical protein
MKSKLLREILPFLEEASENYTRCDLEYEIYSRHQRSPIVGNGAKKGTPQIEADSSKLNATRVERSGPKAEQEV